MGSSQARALISTMLSGEKRARSPAPGLIVKAVQAFMKEAFSPLRDNLARAVQPLCDLLVLHAGSGQQNDLGAKNFAIRGCVLSGSFNKNPFLIPGKRDNEGAYARHFAFLLLEVTFIAHSFRVQAKNTSTYLCHRALSRVLIHHPINNRRH